METASQTQQRLVKDFSEFSDDPFALYEYLLGFAADLPVMPEETKQRAHLVEGCQSQVWLLTQPSENRTLHIELDSDTLIVRGILNAIVQIYSDRTVDDILETNFTFLEETELIELFSADRQGGIKAVMGAIGKAAETHRM